MALTMADGNIDILSRKIDVMHRGANAQLDSRVRGDKVSQVVDQPLGPKIGRHGHSQHAGILALREMFGAGRQSIERIPDNLEIGAPGIGQVQPLVFAREELEAECALECLDLMTDCPLRDAAALVKLSWRAAASKARKALSDGRWRGMAADP